MRTVEGWYPSAGDFKMLEPRRDPGDWLLTNTAPGEDAPARVAIAAEPGEVVRFDFYRTVGSALLLSGPHGDYTLDGAEPDSWDACWNPKDGEAREFVSLDDFAARWLRPSSPAVQIEFIRWTRNVPFRIEQRDGALAAVRIGGTGSLVPPGPEQA